MLRVLCDLANTMLGTGCCGLVTLHFGLVCRCVGLARAPVVQHAA